MKENTINEEELAGKKKRNVDKGGCTMLPHGK